MPTASVTLFAKINLLLGMEKILNNTGPIMTNLVFTIDTR